MRRLITKYSTCKSYNCSTYSVCSGPTNFWFFSVNCKCIISLKTIIDVTGGVAEFVYAKLSPLRLFIVTLRVSYLEVSSLEVALIVTSPKFEVSPVIVTSLSILPSL